MHKRIAREKLSQLCEDVTHRLYYTRNILRRTREIRLVPVSRADSLNDTYKSGLSQSTVTSSASTRTFFNEKPSRISKSSFKRERLVSEDVYTTGLRTFESHRGLVPLLFSPGTRPFAAKFRGRMSSDFHPFSFRNRGERERREKGAKAWKRQRNSGERNVKGTDRFGMKLTRSIARLFPLSILPSSL